MRDELKDELGSTHDATIPNGQGAIWDHCPGIILSDDERMG